MDASNPAVLDLLDTVLITAELASRPAREPDFQSETIALRALVEELSRASGNVLQSLSDAALRLCHARCSGVSLLEMGDAGKALRWHAVSGAFAARRGAAVPYDGSPCGVVIDRNAVQLMREPQRHFRPWAAMAPPIAEALLVPFHVLNEPVGTVWALCDESKRFDCEDVRLIGNLAKVAEVAYLLSTSLAASRAACEELTRSNARLQKANRKLWQRLVAVGVMEPDA
jgi:GAF domain-containing protein